MAGTGAHALALVPHHSPTTFFSPRSAFRRENLSSVHPENSQMQPCHRLVAQESLREKMHSATNTWSLSDEPTKGMRPCGHGRGAGKVSIMVSSCGCMHVCIHIHTHTELLLMLQLYNDEMNRRTTLFITSSPGEGPGDSKASMVSRGLACSRARSIFNSDVNGNACLFRSGSGIKIDLKLKLILLFPYLHMPVCCYGSKISMQQSYNKLCRVQIYREAYYSLTNKKTQFLRKIINSSYVFINMYSFF